MKKILKLIFLLGISVSVFMLRGCLFFYKGKLGKLAIQEDSRSDISDCNS
jgi:hypothetical protein